MKKQYADLHLRPRIENTQQTTELLQKTAELGYHLIGVSFPPNCNPTQIQQVKATCHSINIDLATRVDLNPRTRDELINHLRGLRRKFEIISVMCSSKDVARQAAKDRRVDLLRFPCDGFSKRLFDISEAELASTSLASLEIDTAPLITLEGSSKSRLLSSLRKEAVIAKSFDVPIVISSGADNAILLRKPLEQAALASLFDLQEDSAVKAVSTNPMSIVKRNKEKLNPQFVAPGIRLIRRGKDC